MNAPENELLFTVPDTLTSRRTEVLTNDDLLFLVKALQYCLCDDIEYIARMVFRLPQGDVENAKSDSRNNRFNMIDYVVRKWSEILQDSATPEALIRLLEENQLLQVQHHWWKEYFDENTAQRMAQYLHERTSIFDEICRLSTTETIWNDLLSELRIQDMQQKEALQKHPYDVKMQRMFVLDRWTFQKGYNEASNSCLKQAFQAVKSPIRVPESDSNGVTAGSSSSAANMSCNSKEYDFGLYFDSTDKTIAARIKSTLISAKYRVCCFDDFPSAAGISKSSKAPLFSDRCTCVLWIATPQSVKSGGYHKYYREVLTHKSITEENVRGAKHFIVLKPEEYINKVKIPVELDAHDPLLEDTKFLERVEVTYVRIKKKNERKRSAAHTSSKPEWSQPTEQNGGR